MFGLVGRDAVVSALRAGGDVRVLDPACGTGGFLIFMVKAALGQLDELLAKKTITKATRDTLAERTMKDVFYGSDANEGVAAAAKMNMIVAGDGHSNIFSDDSLASSASCWSFTEPGYDFILTNPPFGTSESSSLSARDKDRYPVKTTKGQLLFLQRMVLALKPGGYICTVIDEGALNTDTAKEVRRWVLQNTELRAVIQLPDETFKPNKINVRSSVLLLRRREHEDVDLEKQHSVTFCELKSLGYTGSSDVRGFDFARLRSEVETLALDQASSPRAGYEWRAFDVAATDIASDPATRLDLKYWDPEMRKRVATLMASGAPSITQLNTVPTSRGKSPPADLYVDQADGYAVVIKAGSSISRFGQLVVDDADYIEKLVYDEMSDTAKLKLGDVLLASTGDGTLGKVCVYDRDGPAVADGHVTIIRVNPNAIDPYFLADYLRCGFGHDQIQRLYSGATGLVELTRDHVNRLLVDAPSTEALQKKASSVLREYEAAYKTALRTAEIRLRTAHDTFRAARGTQEPSSTDRLAA
jgi:type I restriction enzyme M protein